MIRLPPCLILLACTAVSAQEETHLLPEDTVFADAGMFSYYNNVGQLFRDVLPYTMPRVVALPSFANEFVLGIEHGGREGCAVVHAAASLQLWRYELAASSDTPLPANYPDDPLDVPLVTSRRAMTPDICSDLARIWEAMLFATRYPQPGEDDSIVIDGTAYHFSMFAQGRGVLAGQTRSPDRGTLPGQLVELTHLLQSYAGSGAAEDLEKVRQALQAWPE